jgi:peptidoglycan/LPS O-acetylase OafA/YrhL
LSLTLPSIFETFRQNRIDRAIGELSYPMYITHLFVLSVLLGAYPKVVGGAPPSLLYLFLVFAASIMLYVLVDRPMDRLRHHLRNRSIMEQKPRGLSPSRA